MKMSPEVFYVTAVLVGVGFVRRRPNLPEVTLNDVQIDLELTLRVIEKPEHQQSAFAVMQALHDRGFGVEGFVPDETFGDKARQSLNAYVTAFAREFFQENS